MAKRIGGKAAKIALAAVGAAALSAVGTGAVTFVKWAKDPYSKELWFGFLKKGVLITKTDEPHHYRVQTGYRWHADAAEEEQTCVEEPEIEISLKELVPEPAPGEAPEAEAEAAPESEAEAEDGNEA